jgi:PPM family protein phosphatase
MSSQVEMPPPSHSHRLEAAGATDVGKVRAKNEDSSYVDLDLELFMVADGMGGHRAGAEASRLAVQHVAARYRRLMTTDQPGMPLEPVDRARAALRESILYANKQIRTAAAANPDLEGMGTTLVAVAGVEDVFVVAHIGDSRAYLVRGGSCASLTTDHSLLEHFLEIGRVRQSEARNFPQRNIILRALGLADSAEADFQLVSKVTDDLLMLCTDGLTDMLEDHMLAKVISLSGKRPPRQLGQLLVQGALKAGGEDNVTVLLVRVGEAIQPRADTGTERDFDDLAHEVTREADPLSMPDEVTSDIYLPKSK